jgi:hypothetical protein
MLQRIRRKIGKRKERRVETTVDLDASARSTCYDIGHAFDPSKEIDHFLNFFMILGTHNAIPSLLFVYPAHRFPYSSELFKRILLFCYPNGVGVPGHLAGERIINQFVFGINDATSLIFGICSHVSLRNSEQSFLGAHSQNGIYCFCSMTTLPLLGTHFKYHELLLDYLLHRISEAPAFPPGTEPERLCEAIEIDFSAFEPPLLLHPEDAAFVAYDTARLTIEFRRAIEFYFRLSVDDVEGRFPLPGNRHIEVPKREDAVRELARYGFDILFSHLSLDNVVRVFRSVLLEQKILFVGSDISVVTLCTLAALPLALPMTYRAALLPFLPDQDDFLAFLDSPVPFCFGVLSSDRLQRYCLSPDITVVCLDEHRVVYPEDIPHLPKAGELRASLKELLKTMTIDLPRRPDQVAEFWALRECSHVKKRLRLKYLFAPPEATRLLDVFTKFVQEFVKEEKICGSRVRDTTDQANPRVGFVKEVYMIGISPTDTDFFDHFVQTQAFVAYFEHAATVVPGSPLIL